MKLANFRKTDSSQQDPPKELLDCIASLTRSFLARDPEENMKRAKGNLRVWRYPLGSEMRYVQEIDGRWQSVEKPILVTAKGA